MIDTLTAARAQVEVSLGFHMIFAALGIGMPLWRDFMQFAGPTSGSAFTLEGFAFFIEAIFLGLYLYGGASLFLLFKVFKGADGSPPAVDR